MDIATLKAHSLGREILARRKHPLWYTYGEPVVAVLGYVLALVTMGALWGLGFISAAAGGAWAIGGVLGL